jgi:hypothetical protein
MAGSNVSWGAPRIHGELLKLGFVISERSVSRFMPKKKACEPPSQTWRTLVDSHLGSLASIDFFAVPTATFRVLLLFFVLRHDRRRVVHFNITDRRPTVIGQPDQDVANDRCLRHIDDAALAGGRLPPPRQRGQPSRRKQVAGSA